MQIGDYRVEVVPDTEFRLDGGAMFGVVPRVVWERVCPPDELNRIRLNCNCLFIDTGKEKILIETGMGERWSAKQLGMYGVYRNKPFARSLHEITGSRPEEITIVINTHLHFDHAGGNTILAEQNDLPTRSTGEGGLMHRDYNPQFPNARYLISRAEFEHAESPHERDQASYLSENWQPMIDSKQLELMPETYSPVDGLAIEQVRGRSETMQTIKPTSGGETLFGFFDMVPTRHHLPLPWIMSYDLFPTETLEFKRRILPQALAENWTCHFYHDFDHPLCRLAEVNGKITPLPLEN